MSHSPPSKFTRRALLAGTAAGIAAVSLPVSIAVAGGNADVISLSNTCSSSVCADHHRELSHHLRQVLDAAYVDENTKNTVLRTTTCPHCQVGIHPAESSKPGFSSLAA